MKTKIAVTYENGEVFQHFGHTKEFKFYTVEAVSYTHLRAHDTYLDLV